jgi:ferric-dicitrate binding protein FerR (iron transport regulator)
MNLRKLLRPRNVIFLSIIVVVVIGLAIFITLPSGASSNNLKARLSEILGTVLVKNGTQAPFNPVSDGFELNSIMQLQTKAESRARLDLSTGSIVRVGPTTVFSLESQQAQPGGVLSQIKLQAGKIWTILNGGTLEVNTPAGLASVRGSYLSVYVDPQTNRITVMCLEGHCGFQDAAGVVELTSGQKVISLDPNVLPAIEKMDQADIQDWLANCPEAAAVIPGVLNLLASSTPTLTATLTTATATPTPTSLSTLSTAGAVQLTGAAALTATASLLTSQTPTLSPSPTVFGFFTPTATLGFLSSSPTPTNGFTLPTPTSALQPTATKTPLAQPTSTLPIGPTNTPLPLPTNTPLPRPTNTPLPPPTNTPLPPPTSTPGPTAYP